MVCLLVWLVLYVVVSVFFYIKVLIVGAGVGEGTGFGLSSACGEERAMRIIDWVLFLEWA